MKRSLAALLVFLAAAVPAFADCPSVKFTLEQTHNGDDWQYAEDLQTIDYDHDGKLDVVGALKDDSGFFKLYSWRGVGDGTFEPGVSLGENDVFDVQIANVNGDAYDDIVGASYDNHFFVRLGNAAGFNAAIVTNTNYAVYEIRAGNFNEGNASIDVVAGSLTSGLFVVYQGNGDGTFTETRRVSVGVEDWLTGMVVADFDNDTRFDVALTRRMSQKVEVYFRNGDGTFAAPVQRSGGNWPEEIEAGDFNEDGLLDLASINWEVGTVDVYLNQGSRAFAARQILDGALPGDESGLHSIRLTDINSDGNLDILAGSVNGYGWLAIFLGRGDGGFATPNFLELPDDVFGIAAGNFDGATDADPELALGSYNAMFFADYGCSSEVHLYSLAPMVHTSQAAKFRAVVSGISSLTPLPRGTVTFKEGATTLGTADVGADGVASLDYNGLAAGNHNITAEFSGNSVLAAAVSAVYVQKVTSSTSSTAITVGTSTHGEPFNSTVAITNVYGNPDHGYYYLTLDGVTETARRWSGAPLTLTLSAGNHSISAEFTGDSFNPPSTSPTYNFTTAKHAVNVSRGGETTVRAGTAHAIQITVSATTSPTPTGNVEIFRGTTSIGTGTLNNGVVTINATLPRGAHDCVAVYAGDANYLTGSLTFTLNVLANAQLFIDAYALDSTIAVPAVVPSGTTSATLYRRVNGSADWFAVPGWSLASQVDPGPLARGVLYEYRVDAVVSGSPQQSNVDSALLFTDPAITAGATTIKAAHFTELRDSINALRAMAGLAPFSFSTTVAVGSVISASHLSGLRTAVNEARALLGMAAATYTDPSPAGHGVKRVHVIELRNQTR